MPSLNKAVIMGHLGKDPEIKRAGNTIIANFSVATSEKYKDKTTGEVQQNTEWHKVVLFNKTAEIAEKYLKKGSSVYIEGKIKTEKYKDKEGIERYTTKIFGNLIQMLDGKSSANIDNKSTNDTQDNDKFDDDIPW